MAKTPVSVEKMYYEQALAELEEIIQQLENQTMELEETLKLFERGKTLTKRCQTLLDQAELKVRQLSDEGTTEGEAGD